VVRICKKKKNSGWMTKKKNTHIAGGYLVVRIWACPAVLATAVLQSGLLGLCVCVCTSSSRPHTLVAQGRIHKLLKATYTRSSRAHALVAQGRIH
jgi:hypothetical protein